MARLTSSFQPIITGAIRGATGPALLASQCGSSALGGVSMQRLGRGNHGMCRDRQYTLTKNANCNAFTSNVFLNRPPFPLLAHLVFTRLLLLVLTSPVDATHSRFDLFQAVVVEAAVAAGGVVAVQRWQQLEQL